jgi:hypothetical protein
LCFAFDAPRIVTAVRAHALDLARPTETWYAETNA